jgi:cyclopropane-fatty-acyl-phospholipid synthase
VVRALEGVYREAQAAGRPLPTLALVLQDGTQHLFGTGAPQLRVLVRNAEGMAALEWLDETRVCEAYMAGHLDIEGDLLALFQLRHVATDLHPVMELWTKHLQPRLFGQVESDKRWIAAHYDEDPEFYLLFLGAYRCYSHGIFSSDDEPLDVGIQRKLDFALTSTGAQAGQRVLDIGAGWGAMTEHGGRRGIHITSLTISEQSERYVRRLIEEQQLPCRVIRQHLLEYQAEQPFDAIVNLGVTEHLPDYAATLAQYQRLLKSGGRIYLDACSSRTKFPFSSFMYRYIFPGNPSPLCLHEYLEEVAKTPFEVVAVHNDRHNYELTCRHWAERLEQARPQIVRRWGESWFRRFQLWLWGCVDVFSRDVYGAYRVVLQLRA